MTKVQRAKLAQSANRKDLDRSAGLLHLEGGWQHDRLVQCQVGVLVLVPVMLAAEPVLANWQYTNWEMTPEDVVEASAGQAALMEQPIQMQTGLIEYVAGTYKTGSFSFRVSFLFQEETKLLDRVVLSLENDELASQLYGNLVTEYDEPVEESIAPIQEGESHTAKWEDVENNNAIRYFGIGDIYRIEYAPLSRSEDGL